MAASVVAHQECKPSLRVTFEREPVGNSDRVLPVCELLRGVFVLDPPGVVNVAFTQW